MANGDYSIGGVPMSGSIYNPSVASPAPIPGSTVMGPSTPGAGQQGGSFWGGGWGGGMSNNPLPAIGGAAGGLIGLLAGGGGNISQGTDWGTPYSQGAQQNLSALRDFIGQVQNARVAQPAVDAARFLARQEAGVRGLGGPLAASIPTLAGTNVINSFNQMRLGLLSQLYPQLQQAQQAADQLALMQRQAENQAAIQAAQANAQNNGGIGSVIGSLVGMIPAFGPVMQGLIGLGNLGQH